MGCERGRGVKLCTILTIAGNHGTGVLEIVPNQKSCVFLKDNDIRLGLDKAVTINVIIIIMVVINGPCRANYQMAFPMKGEFIQQITVKAAALLVLCNLDLWQNCKIGQIQNAKSTSGRLPPYTAATPIPIPLSTNFHPLSAFAQPPTLLCEVLPGRGTIRISPPHVDHQTFLDPKKSLNRNNYPSVG